MIIRWVKIRVTNAFPLGLRRAARQFSAEMVIRKRHLRGIKNARGYRGLNGLAMQLGSADKTKEGWVNIDLSPAADLMLDLRDPLPFTDNTFKMIYSEHVLEHFDYPGDITRLLSECYRVLEPGGIFSLSVPDGEPVLRSYTIKREEPAQINMPADLSWCRTHMDCINYFMRQNGEHCWIYDEETMHLLLESVGFSRIQRREFDPALDQEERRDSLFMHCRKPGCSGTRAAICRLDRFERS